MKHTNTMKTYVFQGHMAPTEIQADTIEQAEALLMKAILDGNVDIEGIYFDTPKEN